jgi:hypothetical protein
VITGSCCIRASPTGGWPGRGGFRWTAAGAIESYGGPGLLWYAAETFDDFVLEAIWRISREDDNSGIFLRSPELGDDLASAVRDFSASASFAVCSSLTGESLTHPACGYP